MANDFSNLNDWNSSCNSGGHMTVKEKAMAQQNLTHNYEKERNRIMGEKGMDDKEKTVKCRYLWVEMDKTRKLIERK